MRKSILFALFAFGCLAAGLTALVTTTAPTATAAPSLVGPCPEEPTCPGFSEHNKKAEVCHFDKGKPEGHINCQNEESIVKHIGPGGHDRDYCAADTGGVCIDIPDPSPSPTPDPGPTPTP